MFCTCCIIDEKGGLEYGYQQGTLGKLRSNDKHFFQKFELRKIEWEMCAIGKKLKKNFFQCILIFGILQKLFINLQNPSGFKKHVFKKNIFFHFFSFWNFVNVIRKNLFQNKKFLIQFLNFFLHSAKINHEFSKIFGIQKKNFSIKKYYFQFFNFRHCVKILHIFPEILKFYTQIY